MIEQNSSEFSMLQARSSAACRRREGFRWRYFAACARSAGKAEQDQNLAADKRTKLAERYDRQALEDP